ncbi:MAG: hypothetical protein ABR543_16390 [Gemmatimonadaceae bacterium]
MHGFALAVALAALVLIGVMVGGVFFAAGQELRTGRDMLLRSRALTAAEYGLAAVLARGGWSPQWNAIGVGTVIVQPLLPGDGSVDTVRITKLNSHSFFAASEGFSTGGYGVWARRRIGASISLATPVLAQPGALTVRAGARLGTKSSIDGGDSVAVGWTCPAAVSPIPGLAMADTSQLVALACAGCVSGTPPILETPIAADTNTHFTFGSLTWNDLTAMSGAVIPGGATLTAVRETYTAGGACNVSDPHNWGDPRRMAPPGACEQHFPIVHAQGDLFVAGGHGQGMLLVDGDLHVTGGFQFYGAVIVRGRLITSGSATRFVGAVMAADADLTGSSISYSGCVLARSLQAAATPVLTSGHSWVELP